MLRQRPRWDDITSSSRRQWHRHVAAWWVELPLFQGKFPHQLAYWQQRSGVCHWRTTSSTGGVGNPSLHHAPVDYMYVCKQISSYFVLQIFTSWIAYVREIGYMSKLILMHELAFSQEEAINRLWVLSFQGPRGDRGPQGFRGPKGDTVSWPNAQQLSDNHSSTFIALKVSCHRQEEGIARIILLTLPYPLWACLLWFIWEYFVGH